MCVASISLSAFANGAPSWSRAKAAREVAALAAPTTAKSFKKILRFIDAPLP